MKQFLLTPMVLVSVSAWAAEKGGGGTVYSNNCDS
jgi:hypothetical protein